MGVRSRCRRAESPAPFWSSDCAPGPRAGPSRPFPGACAGGGARPEVAGGLPVRAREGRGRPEAGCRQAAEPAAGGLPSVCRVARRGGSDAVSSVRSAEKVGRGARGPRRLEGAAGWGRWLRASARPWWPRAVVGAAALRPGAVRGRDSRGADARGPQLQI